MPITCPPKLAHCWDDFVDIKNGSVGENISYQDIESWTRLNNAPLTKIEVALIRRIDRMHSDG